MWFKNLFIYSNLFTEIIDICSNWNSLEIFLITTLIKCFALASKTRLGWKLNENKKVSFVYAFPFRLLMLGEKSSWASINYAKVKRTMYVENAQITISINYAK